MLSRIVPPWLKLSQKYAVLIQGSEISFRRWRDVECQHNVVTSVVSAAKHQLTWFSWPGDIQDSCQWSGEGKQIGYSPWIISGNRKWSLLQKGLLPGVHEYSTLSHGWLVQNWFAYWNLLAFLKLGGVIWLWRLSIYCCNNFQQKESDGLYARWGYPWDHEHLTSSQAKWDTEENLLVWEHMCNSEDIMLHVSKAA